MELRALAKQILAMANMFAGDTLSAESYLPMIEACLAFGNYNLQAAEEDELPSDDEISGVVPCVVSRLQESDHVKHSLVAVDGATAEDCQAGCHDAADGGNEPSFEHHAVKAAQCLLYAARVPRERASLAYPLAERTSALGSGRTTTAGLCAPLSSVESSLDGCGASPCAGDVRNASGSSI